MNKRIIIAVLTLVVLGLLTAHFIIGLDYLGQRQERSEMQSLIAEAVQTRAQTPVPPAGLQKELAAAEAELIAAGSVFPDGINSTGVIEDILKLADDCEVNVIPLVTDPWEAVGAVSGYDVFRINLTVTGRFNALHEFISRLENGGFVSLNTVDLNIVRTDDMTPGNPIEVKASLDLAVYIHPAPVEQGESS